MNNAQQSDQLTYSFLFKITPLQIIATKSVKNIKKSILLKLANRTQKTQQLNKAVQMQVDVLYSKTLKKYCPIKGIIKIYDVNTDGSEVISAVGGFQTEELLNQGKNNLIIQRDVGTSKLKMKIEIKNLGISKDLKNKSQQKGNQKLQEPKLFNSRIKTNQYPDQKLQQNASKFQKVTSPLSKTNNQNSNLSIKLQEDKKQKQPYYFKRSVNISNSTVNISNSTAESSNNVIKPTQIKKKVSDTTQSISKRLSVQNISSLVQKTKVWSSKVSIPQNNSQKSISQFSQTYLRQKQNEELGQQLLEQRRKYAQLQQKLSKHHVKMSSLKKKILDFQKQREQKLYHFKRISDGLQTKNGKVWIELNQKQKALSLKYKNKTFQKVFGQFIEYLVVQINKPYTKSYTKQQESDQSLKIENTKFSMVEQRAEVHFRMLNQQLTKKTNQLFALRAKQRQKSSLQIKLKSKEKQCVQLQNQLKEGQILKNSLKQQNQYLKDKDDTLQQQLSEKQNYIDSLKQEITQIEVQYKQMQQTVKNDACEIQQLKEQISNLNETIQSYRLKYGDLKNIKNRALQNQLKECLMWIDQQTRQLQMSDFVQQTEPSHSHNVSEIIKNIELQGASREEMNSIKSELANLIKRIDNFLTK